MNLNKVFLIGRLTADPQLRSTPSGQSVTSFSIATNRVWIDKTGNRKEEVEYHNIVVWGKQAEIASQFLTKGSLVFIEGRIQTRSWQDKESQTRKTTEVVCERMQFGPRAQGGQAAAKPQAAIPNKSDEKQEAPIEEIPIIDIDSEAKEDIKPEDIPF